MSVTISVVVPTHDRPESIGRAIDSILNQTEQADEIIVVDDSSCLKTKSIVEAYDLENIRYVENPSSGASSSRNLGAELAKSNFVAFLDDDDIWLPQKLQLQKSKISELNLDAAFSKINIEYENAGIVYATNAQMPAYPLEAICIENFVGATISAVIGKNIFKEVGGFDEGLPAREEYDLWIKLLSAHASFFIIDEPTCVSYRSFNKRARISSNISNYEKAINMINFKHRDLVSDILTPSQLRLRRSKQYEFLAAQGVSISLKFSPFRYYMLSFINKPRVKPVILALLALISPGALINLRARLG